MKKKKAKDGTSEDLSPRDRFAIKALHGLLSHPRDGEPMLWYNPPAHKGGPVEDNWAWLIKDSSKKWAEAAYDLADAMMAERRKYKE